MLGFEEFLEEGKNDPAIFKVVFMAGGPGSGKSYVARILGLQALGFRLINSDQAFEWLMKKENVSFKMTEADPKRDKLRDKAKGIIGNKQALSVEGRLGMIIDGTGRDYAVIKRVKDNLEELGYETMMVFVNTSLETAMDRNEKRARTVPEKIVKSAWGAVQANIGKFQKLFRNRMNIIDNNGGEIDVNSVYKDIMKFAKSPLKSKKAREWIKNQ